MAYVTTNPPQKLLSNMDGTFNIWVYQSTDASTLVDAANYFTNGRSLGMSSGDIVFVVDTDASPVVTSMHFVNTTVALTVDGTVDITDSLTGVTDSD